MEYAEESKETTYFDEEAAAAKEAVEGAGGRGGSASLSLSLSLSGVEEIMRTPA